MVAAGHRRRTEAVAERRTGGAPTDGLPRSADRDRRRRVIPGTAFADGTCVCATLMTFFPLDGRAHDVGPVGRVARRGDDDDAQVRRVVERRREVVLVLAVRRAERQVHHVDAVGDVAVAVRVEREVHALQQRDAAARGRRPRCTPSPRRATRPGSRRRIAPPMMSATCVPWPPAQSMRGLRSIGSAQRARGRAGPCFADEVVAADHLGGRKEAVAASCSPGPPWSVP